MPTTTPKMAATPEAAPIPDSGAELHAERTTPRRSTTTAAQRLEAGMRGAATALLPSLSEGFTEPEQQLADELSSDRIIRLRADQGLQFVENVQITNRGDLWIPGFRLITEQLARETGLRGMEDDPFPDLPLEEEQPATGAVDGNIVASFVDGVTGQQKIDVLNSCLLAQLAANAKFRRVEQPVEWSNYLGTVLMNLAWVVPSFSFRSLSTTAQRFTIDRVVLTLVKNILTADQIATLTQVMEAMKALEGEDRRFVIFERNARNQSDGNFQFNSVGASSAGTLSMKMNAYTFDTTTNVTNVLWFSFSGNNTKLKVAQSTFVLNEQVFARIRDAIVTKLGNRGIDYIGGLELAEN
jgi:hypothetical protein